MKIKISLHFGVNERNFIELLKLPIFYKTEYSSVQGWHYQNNFLCQIGFHKKRTLCVGFGGPSPGVPVASRCDRCGFTFLSKYEGPKLDFFKAVKWALDQNPTPSYYPYLYKMIDKNSKQMDKLIYPNRTSK